MYERFTDRARLVMQLANYEAQRVNHEYVGPEHLLLGLIKEGRGAAAGVLKIMGVDLLQTRLEVERLMPSGQQMVTEGNLPLTTGTKRVLEYTMAEALNLKHNYVGTEHILLGLVRQNEGVAAQVLMQLGLTLDNVREAVLNYLGCKTVGDDLFSNRLIGQLYVQLQELNRQTEAAVAKQDFDRADAFLDQADNLLAKIRSIQESAPEQTKPDPPAFP